MKTISITAFFCLISFSLLSQTSRIENTKVSITTSMDSMYIKYDLTGKRIASDIKLEVTDQNSRSIQPKNVFGDIGKDVQPGIDKTIIWDMNADGLDLSGSNLKVKVKGSVFVPKAENKIWVPLLYIAAGVSAATGTYAYIRANNLYKDYPPSSTTDDAENLHSDVDRMLTLSRVAFGAAALLGTAGVIVNINHNRHKRSLAIYYSPSFDASLLALTYKF